MDALSERTSTMVMYSLYSFVMQVILLNLLIAMFSSTYEEVKEDSQLEWCAIRHSTNQHVG